MALAACGSGTAGLGGSGTLEGEGAFAVQAAYFQVAQVSEDGGPQTEVTVWLLRDSLSCDQLFLPTFAANESVTVGVRFPEGVFPDQARAYAIDNAQVEHASAGFSSIAQMKVETATEERLVGSFNAREPDGTAQLSGTFDAVRCEASPSDG
jgi:hypothetical protein